MRKRVFFAGAFVVVALLMTSPVVFAEEMEMTREEVLSIKTELKSGKPIKDVLEKYGITMGQIRSVLNKNGELEHRGKKITNTQIAAITETLGLDPETIQEEVEQGKTIQQVLRQNNVTPERVREIFHETLLARKELRQERMSTFHQKFQDWKNDKFSWFKKRP